MSDTLPRPRLRRVEIRDFRAIDHLVIEMPPDEGDRAGALVLAGDNGVGKTSVLEAILILFGRVDLLPADMARPRELVRQGAREFQISGVIDWGNAITTTKTDSHWFEALDDRLSLPGASSFGRAIDRSELRSAMLLSAHGGPYPTDYAVESFSPRREPEASGAQEVDSRGRRSPREERRLSELARRLVNVFTRKRGRDETFMRIESFMRSFFGDAWTLDVVFRSADVGSDPEVVVRDGPLTDPTLTLDAVREQAAQGIKMPRVIPIDRLSSGQMAMLAMTYPFIFGDSVPDLVLIDEPEQHLHVSWQRAFLGALRTLSPTTHFIVATHSPWVLDSVPSHERRELIAEDATSPRAHEAAE